jgi:hypothetical protein
MKDNDLMEYFIKMIVDLNIKIYEMKKENEILKDDNKKYIEMLTKWEESR